MSNGATRFLSRHGESLRSVLPVLLLLVIAATGSSAQGGDVKISVDPVQIVLPADALVQDAEVIGSRTLAVWGSTRVGSDGRARNVLYMQMFEGVTPYGEQKILTSEAAEPSRYLQVVTVGNYFLVAWNDKRNSGNQGYIKRVTSAGTAGVEERMGSGAIATSGMLVTEIESGYLLHWSDSSQAMTIRERQYDRLGRLRMVERSLDSGRVMGVIRLTNNWGSLLLERSELLPVLRATDGTIQTISGAAAGKFATPYYLDEDGSVLSIRDGILRSYRSLLDTLPERSVRLPVATPTAIPTRDSLRRPQVYYAFPYGYDSHGGGTVNLGFSVHSVTEIRPGEFSAPAVVVQRIVHSAGPPPRRNVSNTLVGVTFRRGCGNRYTSVYELRIAYGLDYQGQQSSHEYFHTVPFANDQYGEIPVGEVLSGCGMTSSTWVKRAVSKTASEVDLLVGGSIHRLSAAAARLPSNVADRVPTIMAQGETFLVGYHRLGVDSAMLLQSWGVDGTITVLDSIDVNRAANVPAGKQGIKKSDRLIAGTNAFMLESWVQWREPTDSVNWIDSQRCTIYLPTETGWRQALRKWASEPTTDSELRTLTVARDPLSGDFVLAVSRILNYNGLYRTLLVAAFDRGGTRQWMVDHPAYGSHTGPFALVPISPWNYTTTILHDMLRFERDSLIRSARIGYVQNSRFLPLHNGALLRWVFNPASKTIDLELLDSNGAQLFTTTATLPDSTYDPAIIANPNNNGFIILCASPNGVHAISLDSALATIGPSRRISETTSPVFQPRGAIIGDRLNILWEDRRDGVSDIYGRSLELSRLW